MQIVEMAGIGPVPFCGMLLAELVGGGDPSRSAAKRRGWRGRHLQAGDWTGETVRGGRSQASLRRRSRDAPDRRGGCPHRRLSTRCCRTNGHRSIRLSGSEPEADLRPDDRLGPRGAARRSGRARHQLHRIGRGPGRHRGCGWPPAAAAQPRGGLRRRIALPGARRAECPRGTGELGSRPRSSTPPWWTGRLPS